MPSENWTRVTYKFDACVDSCADGVVDLDIQIIVVGEEVEGSRYI